MASVGTNRLRGQNCALPIQVWRLRATKSSDVKMDDASPGHSHTSIVIAPAQVTADEASGNNTQRAAIGR